MPKKAPAIRVLIADDHPMLRHGLRHSLTSRGIDVIGEASNGAEAVERTISLEPNVVLMDLTMPVLDGIKATGQIMANNPNARVVILTMHADESLIANAKDAGACGYLVKDCSVDDIVSTVTTAASSHTNVFVGPCVTTPHAARRVRTGGPVITRREVEVLQAIASGMSTSEAANQLFVSENTIKNHLASAFYKLDAHDRTQAVVRAARLGLIKIDD